VIKRLGQSSFSEVSSIVTLNLFTSACGRESGGRDLVEGGVGEHGEIPLKIEGGGVPGPSSRSIELSSMVVWDYI